MTVHFAHVQKQRLPRVDTVGAVEAGVGEPGRVTALHVAPHVGAVAGREPAHLAPEAPLPALDGAGTDQRLDLLVHR